MADQSWIKTTPRQKAAWLLAEEGSFEDSGRSRDHVYCHIRGSYVASIYLDHRNAEAVVRSFVLSTFSEANPRLWANLRPSVVAACERLGRHDLAAEVKNAI